MLASRESGIGSRESGVGSRESGVGSRESGVGKQSMRCCLLLAVLMHCLHDVRWRGWNCATSALIGVCRCWPVA
ncbi:hypothetical protein FMO13_05910 [Xanthomonas phaseoli pv. dieffenbachiae]